MQENWLNTSALPEHNVAHSPVREGTFNTRSIFFLLGTKRGKQKAEKKQVRRVTREPNMRFSKQSSKEKFRLQTVSRVEPPRIVRSHRRPPSAGTARARPRDRWRSPRGRDSPTAMWEHALRRALHKHENIKRARLHTQKPMAEFRRMAAVCSLSTRTARKQGLLPTPFKYTHSTDRPLSSPTSPELPTRAAVLLLRRGYANFLWLLALLLSSACLPALARAERSRSTLPVPDVTNPWSERPIESTPVFKRLTPRPRNILPREGAAAGVVNAAAASSLMSSLSPLFPALLASARFFSESMPFLISHPLPRMGLFALKLIKESHSLEAEP